MSDDPHVREIDRITDDAGRILIVGVDHDTVTLHTRLGEPVALSAERQEELAQLLIAAAWQAAWRRCQMDAELERLAIEGGAP